MSSSTPSSNPPSPDPQSSIPHWVTPNLSSLLRIEKGSNYTSRALSLVSLPPGALYARITTPTPAPKAYSTVQAGKNLHIELNSDLLYVNHSCRPRLVFDMERWEVRVAGGVEYRAARGGENGIEEGEGEGEERGLEVGDELTFFYPSTEWEMEQGFECRCGESCCRGWITGARDMGREVLGGYWLSGHVREMLVEKEGGDGEDERNGKK